jgi:hypothetical protein
VIVPIPDPTSKIGLFFAIKSKKVKPSIICKKPKEEIAEFLFSLVL